MPHINPGRPEEGHQDELTTWYNEFLVQFPGWGSLLSSVPNLKDVVKTWWESGDIDQWDYNAQYNGLMAAVEGSNWWRMTEERLRDHLLLQSSDPATWAANNETGRKDAIRMADELGIDFSDLYSDPKYQGTGFFNQDYYTVIGEEAAKNGWTKAQLKDRLVRDGLGMGSTPARGSIKRDMDKILQYGRSMLVDIDPNFARTWAHRMGSTGGFFSDDDEFVHGAMSWEDVKDTIQGLAGAQWDFLDIEGLAERGLTVADTLSTVKSTIASTLELNDEDINLMGMGVENLVKGEGEGRRFINKDDAKNWAKKQSMYQGTDEFRSDVRGLGGAISQLWGHGPGGRAF